jgi:hypothetical protein
MGPVKLLAIDPGPVESAFLLYDTDTRLPERWEKFPNRVCWPIWATNADGLAIEMIASYGMPVGAEVFETCVWIGRFEERWGASSLARVFRRDVKLHLCDDPRAKDSNIRQALVDRYGGKEKAIGRKATPGPLYGLTKDCWAALGVAVTAAETTAQRAAA